MQDVPYVAPSAPSLERTARSVERAERPALHTDWIVEHDGRFVGGTCRHV
jgi:hypothetical protein